MALTPGTRLGSYEIGAQIGVGGMGEVYRATDTKLKREVAIKVLPAALASDSTRLARFQREAEVLASLNHPHIAAIYGLEDAPSAHSASSGWTASKALIMELVEGPTLADRIAQGPIPLDEALPIAKQIAEALEAAHEQGIIHRDLKPANIKVRPDGTVKVLDFGLAKAIEPAAGSSASVSMSPTITTPAMTQAGMILGTAAYMSPEQARGRPVDRRADVWAFGCVLYEMLTGRRAFHEEDVSMTLSKVLQREPNLDALPPATPTRIRQTLAVCFQKDPKRRAQAIGDVQLALEGAFEAGGAQAPVTATAPLRAGWTRALTVALAASLAAAGVVGTAVWSLAPPQTRPIARFDYHVPAGLELRSTGRTLVALSRDGRHFVYNTSQGLYLRAMDELEAHVIPGTEVSLTNPFFSPDGQSVGYWQDNQLKRISTSGGAPVVIGQAENLFGASWEADDTILFAQTTGIMRVRATGGTPQLVIPAKGGEQAHGPQLLPDGDSILFSVTTVTGLTRWDGAEIVVQSLRSGERTVVLKGGSDARYLPTGHLVYAVRNALFAVAFDASRRAISGGPVPIGQGFRRATGAATSTASANYAVSENGTLVSIPETLDVRRATLTWVTREGRETPLQAPALNLARTLRLSPDGTRLAVVVEEDVWVYDIAGRPPIRLTNDGGHYSPLWTPDGQRLVYESTASGPGHTLFVLPADGGGTPQTVGSVGHFHAHGWSADGRVLVAVRGGTAATSNDIVQWPLAKPNEVEPVVATPAREGLEGAAISPDGRWLAYASDQTGALEIWVRPYPGPGPAVRVSPAGGVEPVWARHGWELYYLQGTRLMAVSVRASDRFDFSPATLLFDNTYLLGTQPQSYDVAPDGRFVVLKPLEGEAAVARPQVIVVQNWFEELRRLVPRP